MKHKVEHRTFKSEFRVNSDTGKPTIYGYAAKYNSRSYPIGGPGGFVEIIAPNAFDKTLQTNPDVHALFNHNSDMVLGRTTSGTLRLRSDAVGLAYEVDPPDTQTARDLVELMKRGDVNESSFAFYCNNATWSVDAQTGEDVRTVLEAELIDVSPVTYPAYPAATSGVRSLPDDMPAEVRSRLQKRDAEDGDPDPADCECDCPECMEGDCCDCSDPDCDDPNCVCLDDDMGDDDAETNSDANRSARIRVMLKSLNEF